MFEFNYSRDTIKRGCGIVIDSCPEWIQEFLSGKWKDSWWYTNSL